MSIGPSIGVVGSAAGAPAAQTAGSDVERARQDGVAQKRQLASAEKAENAAGVAETDGKEHKANDRDADGRRLWEFPPAKQPADTSEAPPPLSKDALGERGAELDLSG